MLRATTPFVVLTLCVLGAMAESQGLLDDECSISFESPYRLRVPLESTDSGVHGLTLTLYDGPENEHAWFISTNRDEGTTTVSYASWGDQTLTSSVPFPGVDTYNSALYFVSNALWFRQGNVFRQLHPWSLTEETGARFELPANGLVDENTNWISSGIDWSRERNWLFLGSDDGVLARISLWPEGGSGASVSYMAPTIGGQTGVAIREITVDPVWGPSGNSAMLFIAGVLEGAAGENATVHLQQYLVEDFSEADPEIVDPAKPFTSMADWSGIYENITDESNFFFAFKDLHMDWGVWDDPNDDILYALVNHRDILAVDIGSDGLLDASSWRTTPLQLDHDEIWAYTFNPEYTVGLGFLSYYDSTTSEWGVIMYELANHEILDTFDVSNQRAPFSLRYHHKQGVLATLEYDVPTDDNPNGYTEVVFYEMTCGSGCGKEGINLQDEFGVDFSTRICKICQPGHYSHDPHEACKACPAGTVGFDNTQQNTALTCRPCPEGTKQPYHGLAGDLDEHCRPCTGEKCLLASGVGLPSTYPTETNSRAYVNNLYAALEDSNRAGAADSIHLISFVALVSLDAILLCGFFAWCCGANQADTVGAEPTSPGAPKTSRNSSCARFLTCFDCFYQTSGYTPLGGVVRKRKTALGGFCSSLAALFMIYSVVVLTVEFGLRNDDVNTGILPGSLPLNGPDLTVNVTFPTWGVFDCCVDEDGTRTPKMEVTGISRTHEYAGCHDDQGVCTFRWHCPNCQLSTFAQLKFSFHESFANLIRVSVGVAEDLFEGNDYAYAIMSPAGDRVYRGEDPVTTTFTITPVHVEHYFSHVFQEEYGYLVENGTQQDGATTSASSFANWEGDENADVNDLNVKVNLFSWHNGHVEVEVIPRITGWDFVVQLLAVQGGFYVLFQACMACFVRRNSGGLYESYQDKDFSVSAAPRAGDANGSPSGTAGKGEYDGDDDNDDDDDIQKEGENGVYPDADEAGDDGKEPIEGEMAGGDSIIAEPAADTTTTTTTTTTDNQSLI